MFETAEQVRSMQAVLDRSYERAGPHLLSIHAPEARLTALDLARRLDGMQVFVIATSTREGLPRTGPVDTFLFKGELVFGTARNAIRARHLARSPTVSATHVRGETLVVTVHGVVRPIKLGRNDDGLEDFLRAHYGEEHFEKYLAGAPYFAIVPEWMFAADMGALSPG